MTNYSQQDIEQALLNCEAEPIHQIGQIQPHGVLLVISDSSPRRILQCSANLGHFLGLSFESIQNLLLEEVLGISSALLVEQLILETKENQAATCLLSLRINEQQRELQVRLFMSANLYVLEFMDEDALNSQDRLPEFLKLIKKGLSSFEQDIDIYDYFNRIAVLIRDLTGFDRVMVYRFDINWDGEVIAESRVEEAESYLGLHFPASDIPPQARHLYTLNYIRHIADTSAEPVPVLPVLNPLTGQPLDMSFSSLRCFSPVHREYLRNMGVQASLSISLIQNGRLWGLIACHHLTPRRVSNALEEAATLIGRMASVKLLAIEADNQRKLINKSSHIMGELLKHITVNTEEVIISQLLTELLDLMKATGVMMKIEGKLYTQGEVPSAPIIDDLFTWLDNKDQIAGSFSWNYLSEKFPIADPAATAGLLVTPVSTDMRNCIVWLREEKPRTVKWAGNAQKNLTKDSDGIIRLTPRKSFEVWTELWRNRCEPWTQNEEEVAAMLGLVLTEGLAQKSKLEQALAKQKLADAELAEKTERISEINRRKDEFLAVLAHELRNPLAPIRNATEILKIASPDLSKITWSCNVLDRQLNHLTRLVDDLLDIARINQGHIELKKTILKIQDIIQSAVESNQSLINASRQEFIQDLPQEPIWVEGDAIRLNQIVSNLINNACKYTQEGGRIGLSVKLSESDVYIHVNDTGCGIEPIALPHLFDMFFRAKDGQGGLGIGLYLVHNLVEKHGGDIKVLSAGPEKGSEFVVRLPRIIPAKSEKAYPNELSAPIQRKLRILIVDDNQDAAESLAMVLEIEGHQVRKAFDAESALEIAEGELFDVIVTDIGLPGKDGNWLVREIRRRGGASQPLMIAASGYGRAEDKEKSYTAGFDEYLTKPLEFEMLRRLLVNCHVHRS